MTDARRKAFAQAICKSASCEGINCCQWPANRGRKSCPVNDGGYDDAANAVLALLVDTLCNENEKLAQALSDAQRVIKAAQRHINSFEPGTLEGSELNLKNELDALADLVEKQESIT